MFPSLREFLSELKARGELLEVSAEVDANLEIAEIHRRVIEEQGPALLFSSVKGSSFPVVTNLFGTAGRTELAFGENAAKFIEEIASAPEELLPPTFKAVWEKRQMLLGALKIGLRSAGSAAAAYEKQASVDLEALPILTSWPEDGGPFVTLPVVHTEHPDTHVHNIGMYRLQRFDKTTTGLHCQIGKGGGFHLHRAGEKGERLPVHVYIGGPPALILSAIAPLPENVPELLFASLVLGKKVRMCRAPESPMSLLADAEFCLLGDSDPNERKPEGPFGDHYGYYSLTHDFPVFNCKALYHKKDAIYPATIVGKPRQEDFFIGDRLQEILAPLFPLVMPSVKDLWSYGETGFHSLSAACVTERYKREALMSGFRILGEGQLSLSKFLLLYDNSSVNIRKFRDVFEYILARCRFESDLYVFSNTSMDTLDYTGRKLNEGSKGFLVGLGEPIRELPSEYRGDLPRPLRSIAVFCRGCLVVSGESFSDNPSLAEEVAKKEEFADWPMIILCDDAEATAASESDFLWTTFTRFAPGHDIYAKSISLRQFHPEASPPIVIDARMKPGYPDVVTCDEVTKKTVDTRWKEYFPSGF